MGGGPGRAQDALLSAISVDNALAPRETSAEMHEAPVHGVARLGPVFISHGVHAGMEYNDNINGSEADPQPDTVVRCGINLGLIWPLTGRSLLRFGAGLGYARYFEHTRNGGLEVSPASALTWRIGFKDASLTLYDDFSYSRQVVSEPTVANVATLPRLNNTVGARAAWEPDRWILQAGYGHNTFLSTDNQYDYLNRSSEFLFARAGRRLAERTQAGIEASTGFTSYLQSYQSDSQSLSAGPYVEWQTTEDLRVTARAGPAFYFFHNSPTLRPDPGLNSYYAALRADHRLTEVVSHGLFFQRDVSAGLDQGSSYVEKFSTGYSISVDLTRRIGVGGDVVYDMGNQPLVMPAPGFPRLQYVVKEDFKRVGWGLRASYALTSRLGVSARYNWYARGSSLPGRGYGQNMAGLQVNYTF
jgi:hypothetical protein